MQHLRAQWQERSKLGSSPPTGSVSPQSLNLSEGCGGTAVLPAVHTQRSDCTPSSGVGRSDGIADTGSRAIPDECPLGVFTAPIPRPVSVAGLWPCLHPRNNKHYQTAPPTKAPCLTRVQVAVKLHRQLVDIEAAHLRPGGGGAWGECVRAPWLLPRRTLCWLGAAALLPPSDSPSFPPCFLSRLPALYMPSPSPA